MSIIKIIFNLFNLIFIYLASFKHQPSLFLQSTPLPSLLTTLSLHIQCNNLLDQESLACSMDHTMTSFWIRATIIQFMWAYNNYYNSENLFRKIWSNHLFNEYFFQKLHRLYFPELIIVTVPYRYGNSYRNGTSYHCAWSKNLQKKVHITLIHDLIGKGMIRNEFENISSPASKQWKIASK